MRRLVFLLLFAGLFPFGFPAAPAVGVESSLQDVLSAEDARQLAEALQMEGLDRFVADQASEGLRGRLKEKIVEWVEEGMAEITADEGEPVDPRPDRGLPNPELSKKLKEKLKEKLRSWLPGQLKKIVQQELLQGETQKEIFAELDKTLNEQADRWLGGWYDGVMAQIGFQTSQMGVNLTPKNFAEAFASVFNRGGVSDTLSVQLGEIIGKSTANGLQKGLMTLLKGELPEEALHYLRQGPEAFAQYIEKGRAWLPGKRFRALKEKVLNFPVVDLPNQIYGGILAAAGARHLAKFASSCSGFFATCNWHELKRSKEVFETMVWQLKNKKGITLTLGDFAQVVQRLKDQLGEFNWRLYKEVSQWRPALEFFEKLDEIQKDLDKVDRFYDETTGKILDGFDQAIAALQDKVKKISDDLLGSLKGPFLEKSPVLMCANGLVAEGCPDFPLPDISTWEGLKKTLGLEDGLLGKWGNKSPFQYGAEGLSDLLGEGAVELAEALNITGPLAEILDVEKIPAESPSNISDFDPVYLHNGEFYYTAVDWSLPGAGEDFQWVRIYRSRSEFLGVLGRQWTHSFAEKLMPWESPEGPGFTHVDARGKKLFLKDVETTPEGFVLRSPSGTRRIFDTEGRLLRIESDDGRQMKFDYDASGRLQTALADSTEGLHFHYFPNGLLKSVEDQTGRTWSYACDEAHNLVSATGPGTAAFPKGKTTRYAYDEHRMTLVMDPKGQVYLQNFYGKGGKDDGKILAQVYGGRMSEARYNGNDAWVVDRRGVLHAYQHDEEGRLVTHFINGEAGPVGFGTSSYSANPSDLLRGPRTNGGLDAPHSLIAQEGGGTSKPPPASFSYDPWGNIVAARYADGSERRFEVDANNLVTKETLVDFVPSTRRVREGEVLSDSASAKSGRMLRGPRTSGGLDPALPVEGATRAPIIIEERFYQHDANDNIVEINIPSRRLKIEFRYDLLDRMTAQIETRRDKQRVTRYEYDPQGRPVRVIYPLGNALRFDYNEAGERLGAEAEQGNYDPQKSGMIETEERGGVRLDWDANDRLAALTDAQGKTTRYTYDFADRLIAETFPDGTGQKWGYDETGRLMGRTDRMGRELKWHYDENGLSFRREAPDFRQEFFYDEEDRVRRAVDYNDLKDLSDDVEVFFEYDDQGRLTGEKQHGRRVRKTFSPEGRKMAVNYPNGKQVLREYREDERTRLFLDGRPLEPEGVEAAENRRAEADFRHSLSRNPAGSLMNDEDFLYTYDALDRLTSVKRKEGAEIVRYHYDPFGRVAREIRAGEVLEHYHDNFNRIAMRASDNTWRLFVFAAELDRPAAFLNDQTLYFYQLDAHGSVRQISDESGQIIEQYDYEPFGEMTILSAGGEVLDDSAVGNDLGFIGRPFDAQTGLVNLRFRHYAPRRHAFLTPDPLGYKTPFYKMPPVNTPINFSFHHGQGGSARTSVPNYVEKNGRKYLIDFDLFSEHSSEPAPAPETDLFAYANKDPLNYYDPLGLYKIEVELPPWHPDPNKNLRDVGGALSLKNESGGLMAGPYPVLGRSSNAWEKSGKPFINKNENRDPTHLFGDTPAGDYRITNIFSKKDFQKYGPYAIAIDPAGGQAWQAKQNGRAGFFIHGGRSSIPSRFGAGLVPTLGCLRMDDEDITTLVQTIELLKESGDTRGTLHAREVL